MSFLKKIVSKILRHKKDFAPFPGAVISGNFANVKVGRSVSFGGGVHLFATSMITIGDHTMLGKQVMLHTSTHDYTKHPMWLSRIDRPIQVGSHVWIGARAIVLPGVQIGDYSVVGAGSVVTAHVPEKAIVAGNPARIIGYRQFEFRNEVPSYPEGAEIINQGFLPLTHICKKK